MQKSVSTLWREFSRCLLGIPLTPSAEKYWGCSRTWGRGRTRRVSLLYGVSHIFHKHAFSRWLLSSGDIVQARWRGPLPMGLADMTDTMRHTKHRWAEDKVCTQRPELPSAGGWAGRLPAGHRGTWWTVSMEMHRCTGSEQVRLD